MLRGGLPPFFLAPALPERDFQEWMDAYWAKDILELFRLERRSAFQRLVELVLDRSGGIFDASRFARDCGVSRTTIANHLAVLEATAVAHVVRPYSEDLLLNEVHAHGAPFAVHYWCDKDHHEVDFVLMRRGREAIAVECKASERGFDAANLAAFRRRYPKGRTGSLCDLTGI